MSWVISGLFQELPERVKAYGVGKNGSVDSSEPIEYVRARSCATCYYYQTVYERNRPTDRRACFAEHLRAAVGGLDVEDEAEAWADMEPGDYCSRWTALDIFLPAD